MAPAFESGGAAAPSLAAAASTTNAPLPTTPSTIGTSASSQMPTPLPYEPTDRSLERLSLTYPKRLTLFLTVSTLTGVFLGLSHGSKTAALRFRAENAHRLPTSQTGWYLYHKSKNYHAMLGGIKEGGKMGVRLGVFTGLFVGAEEAVDRVRGLVRTRAEGGGWIGDVVGGGGDFGSTVVAGLGVSGGVSLWNRFPLTTAVKTAKLFLVVSLGYGLLQDMVSLMKGRRLGYVEVMKDLSRQWRRQEQAGLVKS